MKPIICVFDDFFKVPDVALDGILSGSFADITNPVDQVIYPGISADIKPWIKALVEDQLAHIVGTRIVINTIFARATLDGMNAPHKIHSDRIMGQFSSHIYLSREWPEEAGTSFWTHVTQGYRHTDETDVALIAKDTNDLTQWHKVFQVQGKFNRLLIHDAHYWHCAEPIGGWGTSPENGRLVLTCFFNLANHAKAHLDQLTKVHC